MSKQRDIDTLRRLAERYAQIANLPVQEERRHLWADHMSLRPTRVPILATFGMHNVWCREVFSEDTLTCQDPFYRRYERDLTMRIFHHEVINDDTVHEPWLTVRAAVQGGWGNLWGVHESMHAAGVEGGAAAFDPPLKSWDDIDSLTITHHHVDEEATEREVVQLAEAIGGILPIDINRTPAYSGFMADLSTSITKLRGMQQLMLDMYEAPDQVHRLLAFMRDGILTNHAEAEAAGDFSLTSGQNQAMCYSHELEPPAPNSGPRARAQIWGFCAAQEYTLVSPKFHHDFLFQYQLPIYEHYGLTHYGCCEDLGRKIDMLRQLKNLRSIAVTPVANVQQCAEQIRDDYVIAWRPNPTDMVCCGYNETLIRRIISEGLAACRGGHPHIHLKDIETVEGDTTRLTRWVNLVRDVADQAMATA